MLSDSKMIRRIHFLLPVLALLCGAGGVHAEPAQLTVGQGWAWIREFFPPSGEREMEQLIWDQPPPEVNLETLQVWNVRRPWPIREWHWARPPEPAAGQTIVWHPNKELQAAPVRDALKIQLAEPLSDTMGHSLTYCLKPFDWQASYRLIVRGIGPESVESVQVDLTALLEIHNGTGAAYPAARVSVVGIDESQLPPPKPFGLLELNPDTPLTDLWLTPESKSELLRSVYPLETEADIPAHGDARIQFACVERKPALITHLCDSREIPSPTPTGGLPLRRLLLIPNTPAMGLGFPLPPGRADLFFGAIRGKPIQSAHVPHTPFPGTLKVDMGPVDSVRAIRQAGTPESLPEGVLQADFSVTLINKLTSPVQIQVVEHPDTPLQWDLVRSSVPCTQTSSDLTFDLTVPPGGTKTLTYRLRMK